MTELGYTQSKMRRRASVVIAALVVILVVGMLSVQTIQTLALVRKSKNDRTKILQAKELNELARSINWSKAETKSLSIKIPETVSTNSGDVSKSQTAIIERSTDADDPNKITTSIRFPAGQPGEIATTWEHNLDQANIKQN